MPVCACQQNFIHEICLTDHHTTLQAERLVLSYQSQSCLTRILLEELMSFRRIQVHANKLRLRHNPVVYDFGIHHNLHRNLHLLRCEVWPNVFGWTTNLSAPAREDFRQTELAPWLYVHLHTTFCPHR